MSDGKTLTSLGAEYNARRILPRYCPRCKVDTQGEPIPEASREAFGNKSHFSRWTGVVDRDRVQQWTCPNGCTFDRFSGRAYGNEPNCVGCGRVIASNVNLIDGHPALPVHDDDACVVKASEQMAYGE